MSRQTKLTEEIKNTIVEHVRNGNFFGTACRLAGVKEATGRSWLARGRGVSGRSRAQIYQDFVTAIDEAEAQAEDEAIQCIRDAARGFEVTTTKRITRPDGSIITETTTTIKRDPNAAKYYLERKHPQRWGLTRLAEAEAAKVLLEAGMLPESVLEAIISGGEKYTSDIIESWNTSSTDPLTALDALVRAGIIPHELRNEIKNANPEDRQAIARTGFENLFSDGIGDEEEEE